MLHLRFRTVLLPAVMCLLLPLLLLGAAAPLVQARPQQNLAPTYRIFATREGLVGLQTANGHIIQERDHFVALPSWRVLSSYQGYEYQVRITYNGRTTIAPVWDVGPWNTNDSYWSPDRGDYPDLPIGVPQAQAAYFDGHNGGKDEFGRTVNNPNGIDIADGTFWDSLGMTSNDYVDVTFLWLGEDPGPGAAAQAPIPPPPPADPPPSPPDPEQPDSGGQPAANPDPPANPPAQQLDNPTVAAGAIAVDNDDSNYDRGTHTWETSQCGLNGTHDWAYAGADSSHSAMWSPSLDSGAYDIAVYIPGCSEVTPTTSARYTIYHDGGESEVAVNQEAQAGTWVSLGNYHFGRETAPTVELSAATGESERAVLFDALVWSENPDGEPPVSSIVAISRQDNGYMIEWEGEDDSGIDSYDIQVRQMPSGRWRNWQRGHPGTSAWFGPDEGRRHFAFRVRARDNAGNEEEWPLGEDGYAEGIMDTTQAEEEPQP
jgi:hypothetical protein